jgi:hypothetical protein
MRTIDRTEFKEKKKEKRLPSGVSVGNGGVMLVKSIVDVQGSGKGSYAPNSLRIHPLWIKLKSIKVSFMKPQLGLQLSRLAYLHLMLHIYSENAEICSRGCPIGYC